MPKGSESASWAWSPTTRHCDTCGNELRIKDVALFWGRVAGNDRSMTKAASGGSGGLNERFIRCFGCVEARVELAIEETRRSLAARPVVKRVAA